MITIIMSLDDDKVFFRNKMLKLTKSSLHRLLRLENNAKIVRVSKSFDIYNRLVVSFVSINDPMLQVLRKRIECTLQIGAFIE